MSFIHSPVLKYMTIDFKIKWKFFGHFRVNIYKDLEKSIFKKIELVFVRINKQSAKSWNVFIIFFFWFRRTDKKSKLHQCWQWFPIFYSFVRLFLLNVYFCFVLCCVECCLIILVHSFAGSWLIFSWINWNRSHAQWSTWTNVAGWKNKSITSTLARYSQNISMTINHSFASAFSISGFFMHIFCTTLSQKFNSGREKKKSSINAPNKCEKNAHNCIHLFIIQTENIKLFSDVFG